MGSILSLQYSHQLDTLFSASLDKTVRIWKQSKERAMMYHPWYVQVQQVYNFSSPKTLQENKSFCAALLLKKKEQQLTLYAGDSEGSVHILRPEPNWLHNNSKADFFLLEKTNFAFHRLLIIQLLAVEKENHVFTIGYDQRIQGFDDLSGKKMFTYINPNKCLFTCIQWDYVHQELVAVDEQGSIYYISLLSDKSIQTFVLFPQEKIVYLEIVDQDQVQSGKAEDLQLVIIVLEQEVNIVKVRRGVKQGYILDEHTESIIGLQAIQSRDNDSPDDRVYHSRIISCSLDNTIKVWDPKNMSCLQTINNTGVQEFSSFIYLPENNVFCTGHEQGIIKMWNLDNQTSISLDYKNNPQKHNDFITALASGSFTCKQSDYPVHYEYLFATGYDARISLWEIAHDQHHVNASISPQLKAILYTQYQHEQSGIDNQQILFQHQGVSTVGKEILALVFYKAEIGDTPSQIISAGNKAVIYIHKFSQDNKVQANNLLPFKTLEGHSDSINVLRLDQNYLFSGSDDKSIIIWDVTAYFQVRVLDSHHSSPVRDILLVNEFIVSCAFNGKIHIYNYHTQEMLDGFSKNEAFKVMTYLERENKLFVGTDDKNIFCFDLVRVIKPGVTIPLQDEFDYGDYQEVASGDTSQND